MPLPNEPSSSTRYQAPPQSAQLVADGLQYTKADVVLLAPFILEEIAKSSTLLETISHNLETIFYAGGDVSQASGDTLTSRVRFFNVHGATEMGSFPALRRTGPWCDFRQKSETCTKHLSYETPSRKTSKPCLSCSHTSMSMGPTTCSLPTQEDKGRCPIAGERK